MEKRARAKAPEITRPDEAVAAQPADAAELEQPVADQPDRCAAESSPDGLPTYPDLYGRLAAPFDVTFRDLRGGVELEYITGEQCTSRLNETLGFMAWSFRVLEHGIHAEADECWVLGELTVTVNGQTVTRQQFGSQKIKRSRSSGTPLDIGFDLKGAATDALKKCASLIGVGLYLWKKEPPAGLGNGGLPTAAGGLGAPQAASGAGSQANGTNGIRLVDGAGSADVGPLYCEECGEPLTETRFKDGTNWPPAQLAVFGRRKHSRILCMTHYREANQAKRRAEEALQQVPF